MTCIAIDPTCTECETNGRTCSGACSDLCRLVAEMIATEDGHKAWHRAHYCGNCGRPKDEATRQPCRYGKCTVWNCAGCGVELSSAGPVACRCNSTWITRLWLWWWNFRDRLHPEKAQR